MASLSRSGVDDERSRPARTWRPEGVEYGILSEFVGMYLRMAYERAYDDFRTLLGPDALRPGYFTILTLIVKNPGIGQTDLGRAAGRDKSSIAKALRDMEADGLVARNRPRDDRRSQVCIATEAGCALQARMEEVARVHVAHLHDAIDPQRRGVLVAILTDLIENLPDPRAS
jgi:DNA-binding MarR family transcriptional regulator